MVQETSNRSTSTSGLQTFTNLRAPLMSAIRIPSLTRSSPGLPTVIPPILDTTPNVERAGVRSNNVVGVRVYRKKTLPCRRSDSTWNCSAPGRLIRNDSITNLSNPEIVFTQKSKIFSVPDTDILLFYLVMEPTN